MNISGTGNVGVLPLAILTAGGRGGVGLTVFSYKKTYVRSRDREAGFHCETVLDYN